MFARPTQVRMRMASTFGGMRRILKKKGTVPNYIRQAVETGVYRSNAEMAAIWRERREAGDDLRTIMRRFRQDVVRGSNVHDYPVEYLILNQHPPIPDPPRTPKKLLRRMMAEQERPNPTVRLVDKYLQREEGKRRSGSRGDGLSSFSASSSSSGEPETSEEYYRRLLGVPSPELSSSSASSASTSASLLAQKPAIVQRAYAMAIKHYELQRTEMGLSDEEAVARVDEILAEQEAEENRRSRERAKLAKEYRAKQREQQKQQQEQRDDSKNKHPSFEALQQEAQDDQRGGESADGGSGSNAEGGAGSDADQQQQQQLETIFGNKPRVMEGMMRWSERLTEVPYREWTVGASVALDHWIARHLLGLSEETWQLLLEGHSVNSDSQLLARGRDVVAVREALFPETILDRDAYRAMQQERDEDDQDAADELGSPSNAQDEEGDGRGRDGQKSIEELLESLGGLRKPKDGGGAFDAGLEDPQKGEGGDSSWNWLVDDEDASELDRRVGKIVSELQGWRRMNVETPYSEWPKEERDRLRSWVTNDYATALMSDAERGQLDVEATIDALLSEPPLADREESEAFWSQLEDDALAVELLEKIRDDGPLPGVLPTGVLPARAVWDSLDYDEQLRRLRNLGALRPLLDEYTKESDRTKFLQRHGDALLEGVELEHLVPDPDGPIQMADLGESVTPEDLGVPKGTRFRLEIRPYRSSDNLSAQERTRALLMAWNQHKAGRARYEEKMFRTGRLGLRYGDELPDENAILEDPEEDE